jgi:hypothetical protein
MMLGKIVFDHRPPLALRTEGDDANDPDRLVAICVVCHEQKTPRDIREIARTKRLALDHQEFIERMQDKVTGRPVPSKRQWQKLRDGMKSARGSLSISETPRPDAAGHKTGE